MDRNWRSTLQTKSGTPLWNHAASVLLCNQQIPGGGAPGRPTYERCFRGNLVKWERTFRQKFRNDIHLPPFSKIDDRTGAEDQEKIYLGSMSSAVKPFNPFSHEVDTSRNTYIRLDTWQQVGLQQVKTSPMSLLRRSMAGPTPKTKTGRGHGRPTM